MSETRSHAEAHAKILEESQVALKRSSFNIVLALAALALCAGTRQDVVKQYLSENVVIAAGALLAILALQHVRELAAVQRTRRIADELAVKIANAEERLADALREKHQLQQKLDEERRLASLVRTKSLESTNINDDALSDGQVNISREASLDGSVGSVKSSASGKRKGGMLRRLISSASARGRNGSRLSSKKDSQNSMTSSISSSTMMSVPTCELEPDNEAYLDSPVSQRSTISALSTGKLPVARVVVSDEAVVESQSEQGPAFRHSDAALVRCQDIYQPILLDSYRDFGEEIKSMLTPEMTLCWGGQVRTLERFVKARKDNMKASVEMFKEAVEFRAKYQLDDPESELSRNRRKWSVEYAHLWAGKFMDFTTNDGSPIQLFTYRHLDPAALMKTITEEQFAQVYLDWMERTLQIQNLANSREYRDKLLAFHGAKQGEEHEWKAFIELHDLSGIGRKQLGCISGIQMLVRVLKLGQGNYPENLRQCVICNAPWLFDCAWSLISKALDPATAKKVIVDKKIPRKKLSEFLTDDQIDRIFKLNQYEERSEEH